MQRPIWARQERAPRYSTVSARLECLKTLQSLNTAQYVLLLKCITTMTSYARCSRRIGHAEVAVHFFMTYRIGFVTWRKVGFARYANVTLSSRKRVRVVRRRVSVSINLHLSRACIQVGCNEGLALADALRNLVRSSSSLVPPSPSCGFLNRRLAARCRVTPFVAERPGAVVGTQRQSSPCRRR